MQEKKPLFQADEHYWKLKTLIEFNRLTWTTAVAFVQGHYCFSLTIFSLQKLRWERILSVEYQKGEKPEENFWGRENNKQLLSKITKSDRNENKIRINQQ